MAERISVDEMQSANHQQMRMNALHMAEKRIKADAQIDEVLAEAEKIYHYLSHGVRLAHATDKG